MRIGKNSRIVMTGDSITDVGRARPIGEGHAGQLGAGYPYLFDLMLWSGHPELRVRVTNTGISGDTSRDLLSRFQPDVLDLAPSWVTILIGINDVWRNFDKAECAEAQVPFAEYTENLTQMVTRAKAANAGVTLLSPFFIDAGKGDPMQAMTDRYIAACAEVAEQTGASFINLQEVFDAFLVNASPYMASGDRVHPNGIGHALIARALMKAMEFSDHQA